jgi:hypothetical protein
MAKKSLPVEKLTAAKAVPVKIVNDSSSPAADKQYEDRERKYRAKSALEDIERAEGHKKDKALMKDVKDCAREKMKTYGKL